MVQAEDELDQQEWMEAIQGVTACLLNGDVDVEALARAQPKPARPTHSRQGSRAGAHLNAPFYDSSHTWCTPHAEQFLPAPPLLGYLTSA